MKKYEIEVFERQSNGRLGNRVRDLEGVLFANSKQEAINLEIDIISATTYNSIYPDSNDSDIIGFGRAKAKFAIYAYVLKD